MGVVTYGTCRGCCEMKPKIRAGNYASGIPRFVDERGKVWVGRWCGPCWNLNVKLNGKDKRRRGTSAKSETERAPTTLVLGAQNKLGKVKNENSERAI